MPNTQNTKQQQKQTTQLNAVGSHQAPQRRSLLHKILLPLSLTLFSIIISLIAIEVTYRVAAHILPQKEAWSDRPDFYYKVEAAETLQDYSYNPVKPAGTYRIGVLGDSFTFAPFMQFDDTFPKKLERMLNLNKETSPVEVLNYGVPGYSISHHLKSARIAIEQGADLLLLQITLNDPQLKPYRPTGLTRANEFGSYQPDTSEGGLFSYWRSLQFIQARLHNNETHTRYQEYYFKLFEDRSTWGHFKKSIQKLARLAKRHEVTLVATTFPLFGLPLNENYPFHPLHQKVSDTLQEHSIIHLDLFETYQHIPLERLQVIPQIDFHPNEIGHRLAAESIYSWLVAQNILPKELVIHDQFRERSDIRVLEELRIGLE